MRRVANIYKDKKRGTWFFSATIGHDKFGKRIQVTRRGFKTQGEAKKVLEELKQNFSDSQGIYLQGITFYDFYQKYFFPWYKLGTVEKTYVKTNHTLQRALDFFGKMQLEKIRPIHIQEFQQFLVQIRIVNKGIEQPLSQNYIKQIFNKLRVVFKRAIALEIIEENPVDTIGKIKSRRPQIEFWTVDEFKKVYNSVYSADFYEEFYKRLMRFIFVTGVRSEELLALQWNDFDLSKGTCSINKSIYIRTRQDYEFAETKNTSSIRTISLDKQTVIDLKTWKNEQQTIGENIELVFSYDGLPPSPRTILRRIKQLAEFAGVKPIHLHGLRHSHVAFLIEHNKNIYAISKRLGHASIKTTLDKYGHLYPETNQALADEFTRFDI
ncbi:site-specific integrase [Enterococcus columbae]|uniref:Phage integrase n=1 Tax=Enterococcus columbae DSM 7374 = ATCC 51263 TaxID=1121865 RepID=S0KIK0_9ENTE|nr:site-specific integrase [Enterococcus columbae]EOT44522.1 phage integrase [Enterococcus columbae DSM 7374 = ATCC 51263]EOW84680.1 phage integrase [Enterococcus columbae DSM 7374 = ATCC 51263]OJG21094.1 phage integrase [Enterococcus columbae DSM 7374 = ATCC 51263]